MYNDIERDDGDVAQEKSLNDGLWKTHIFCKQIDSEINCYKYIIKNYIRLYPEYNFCLLM